MMKRGLALLAVISLLLAAGCALIPQPGGEEDLESSEAGRGLDYDAGGRE